MDNILEILQIALLIYLGLLGTYFLPSYFKKKAENFAQVQDIQKLTTLVKEVEFGFEEKLHNLKLKLELSSQFQYSLLDEERSSLLKLYTSLREFYNILTDLSFGQIDMENNNELRKCQLQMFNLGDDVVENKSYLELFLDTDNFEIKNKSEKLFSDLLKFKKTRRDQISTLIEHNRKYEVLNTTEATAEFYNVVMELDAKYASATSKLISDVNLKFNDLVASIKSHLKSRSL